MQHKLVTRRTALAAVSQLGIVLAAAACAPTIPGQASATVRPAAPPTETGAASPSPSGSLGASPGAVASPQSSPVVGAAPLPIPPPTPGGLPPTPVGLSSTPQPNPAPAASPSAQPNVIAVVSPSAQPVAATVMITTSRSFDPPLVSISRGQTVQWRNQSRNPQTVTCNPALASTATDVSVPSGASPFDSGVINPSATFTYTFNTPGSYQYVSLPFEAQQMTGQITVE